MLVDCASQIEVANVRDRGSPTARQTGRNPGMLYKSYIERQSQGGCWHELSTPTIGSDL